MEEQLEALHCVSVNDRILHFDATGGLVNAKGDGAEYGQILTYAIMEFEKTLHHLIVNSGLQIS